MSSNAREAPTDSMLLNTSRKPLSMVQPPSRRASRDTLGISLTSGTTKSAQSEAKSRVKAATRSAGSQEVWEMFGFRASILALDTYAEFFVDRHRLKVIHSKCGGKIMQKAANDTSNFREHVSVCQGPHSSTNDDSFLKGSLRCGPGPSTHPSMVARPGRLLCPGFSFDRLFGRDYGSLLNHEREQVTRAAKVAGLVWLDSREKSSIISTSCLRNSPSHQGPAQACRNCTKVLELSNFKHTLRRKTSKSNIDRFTPFRAIDSKAIAAYEDRKPTNGKI